MTRSRNLLVAVCLLLAMTGAACSSTPSVDTAGIDSSGVGTDIVTQQTPATEAQTGDTQAGSNDASVATVALDTAPLDYAFISGDPVRTVTEPIPCQLAGSVVTAFAESRELPLETVFGNSCRWSSGRTDALQIVFKPVTSIDTDEERRLHGAYDTVVDETGPGTNAASYLDDDGDVERYFFIQGDRAVFLVAESNPTVTPVELRAMADEIAGLVGSAVDEGQRWSSSGEAGEEPLCSVWSDEAILQIFDGTAVFPGGSGGGCSWWIEAGPGVNHQVTLDIDPYGTIETHLRNGGSTIDIGDNAAAITEPGLNGDVRKIAFVIGDKGMALTVDSATHSGIADVLANNLVDRLS